MATPPLPPSPSSPPRPPSPGAERRRQIQNWVVIGVVLIGGLIYLAHTRRVQQQNAAAQPGGDNGGGLLQAADISGKVAPNWTLQDADGKMVSLSQFKGHPIVLDFWATWCGPCQIEMPWWKQIQDQYRNQGLVIIGVSEDSSAGDVQKYLKTHPINYQIVVDLDHLEASYGDPLGLPTTLFIRRDGTISSRVTGLEDKPELDKNVKQIL